MSGIEKAMSTLSFPEFDEYLTRRMLGYNDLNEYYEGINRYTDSLLGA
jgi:hypothetical protein